MQHLKSIYKPFAAALVALFVLASRAGVPVKWIAETSRVHPEIIEAWRGDTLDLSCTLRSYGQPVTLGAATASFMWQTNGMGNAWWQTNATVTAGGVITATWAPTMNPGAGEVAFFMPVVCADGASYRAAGRIRFRPSPGAGSQTVDLPAPGATLDFAAYQLVNAPWATLEAVDSAIDANNAIIADAIASATGAIVVPPPIDLGPYATTGMVAAAVQASGNALAGQISAVSNAAMQRAEMGDYATHEWTALYFATNYTPPDLSAYATRTYADSVASNAQATAIAAIPSLAGYATQSWAANYFATNYTPPDLSAYATRTYADSVAANAQAAAMAAIPSLAGYATQAWAANYFSTNYTPPDLSSYASRSYADEAASNAQATAIAAIPSLAGYATQSWAAQYFATNYTPPDLSSYASRSYADAAASNAQAAAIAAIPSLAGYATETYAQSAAESAASDALNAAQSYARDLSWAASDGNTRLVSTDGTTWQDATGTVWQVSYVYGWAGTVIDLATTTARSIVFTFYGTTTNAPNTSGVETDYWSAGGGTNLYFDAAMASSWELWFVNGYNGYGPNSVFQADGDPTPPITATNLTFTTQVELYSLAYRPVALATNPVDRVLYASGGGGGGGETGDYDALSNRPQINGVTLGGTNNTAVGLGLLGTSGGIVNGLLESSEPLGQSFTGLGVNGMVGYYGGIRWGVRIGTGDNVEFPVLLNRNGGEIVVPSAVGTLALLSDIPESVTPETVTNIVDEAIAHYDPPIPVFDVYAADVTNVADFVTSAAISTNNAAFVEAVLAAPLTGASASDLTEIGEYGSYGTVGAAILALIAGLAALKRGKADKTELPYDIVAVTPANGVVTVGPRTIAIYTAGDSAAAFTVAVGTGETGKARDCELVIDCTATGAVAPTVTWPSMFHPRTDAATDFACEAGKRNVYFISEFATGNFAVGGWQETAGGNA